MVISIDIGSAWIKGFLVDTMDSKIVIAEALPIYGNSWPIVLSLLLTRLSRTGKEKLVISTSRDEDFFDEVKKSLAKSHHLKFKYELIDNQHIKKTLKKNLMTRKAFVLDLGFQLFSYVENLEEVRNYALSSSGSFNSSALSVTDVANHIQNKIDHPNYIAASAIEYAIDRASFYSISRSLLKFLLEESFAQSLKEEVEEIYICGLSPLFMRRKDLMCMSLDILSGPSGVQIYLDHNNFLRAGANLAALGHDLNSYLTSTYFENLGGIFTFEGARKIDLIEAGGQEIDLEINNLVQVKLDEKVSVTQKLGEQGRTLKSGSFGLIFDARPKPIDVFSNTGRDNLIKAHELIK